MIINLKCNFSVCQSIIFTGLGSGPNGRIRAADLLKEPAATPVPIRAVAPAPAAVPTPTPVGIAAAPSPPPPVAPPKKAPAPTPAAVADDSYTDIDLSNIRKVS